MLNEMSEDRIICFSDTQVTRLSAHELALADAVDMQQELLSVEQYPNPNLHHLAMKPTCASVHRHQQEISAFTTLTSILISCSKRLD